MRGLGRYVRILRLFDESHSQWTIVDMAAALDIPASTAYRTVQDMVAANFLEIASEAQYRLGASFIELDRLIRVTDPLYSAGKTVLRDIVSQARVPCVAVLARLYNDTVMCVSQATSDDVVRTSYERGRPRPLTRGATSKVILAQMPTRRLKKLLQSDPGAGDDTEQMREELGVIRKRGFGITRGEVDAGLMGIAAPIAIPERSLLGSLSLVLRAEDVDPQLERRLALLIVSTTRLLTDELTG